MARTGSPAAWLRLAALLLASMGARADAATFAVLHHFDGKRGQHPVGALAVESSGSLYGTTMDGGKRGDGVLFRLSAATGYQVLHSFKGGADGAHPLGSLLLDGAGHVYGTTFDGGRADAGTVFRMDASGGYARVASLDGSTEGKEVYAGLALGSDGRLYGAASMGGAQGLGTLLGIDPVSGAITVIHAFDSDDGAWPESTPVWSNGSLVGTTWGGSVYTLKADGAAFQVVDYGDTQDSLMYAGPTLDASGSWWGAMLVNGADSGDLWRIAPDGTFSLVYEFDDADRHDGINPAGTLLLGADGMLYGTTRRGGGPCSCGTVFRFDPVVGTLETLHQFTDADGRGPWAGLAADGSGNFYGVTEYGGKHGLGVVYRITP